MNAENTGAVVCVGDGRGFVIEPRGDRLIVTAAHCLPTLPEPGQATTSEERTFQRLIGHLGQEPTIWAECLFVDPIRDVAVLGPVDGQELSKQWDAYVELVDAARALPVADQAEGEAWLLSLDGKWFPCAVTSRNTGSFSIEGAGLGIRSGMSGSPILSNEGAAIGIVCTSCGRGDASMHPHTQGHGNARLAVDLPGWLLRDLRLVEAA